jgi:predicted enzyme related to lactoylglutathione lyase
MNVIARIIVLTAAIGLQGCATQPLSPITLAPTDSWNPGRFVWADLLTDDVSAARDFYADVFGWQFDATGDDHYSQATYRGRPIAGIAHHVSEDSEVREVLWLVSVSVDDVNSAAAAVVAAGGEVLEDARDVPDRGRLAVVADNEAAVLVLLRAGAGDPRMQRAWENEWIWAELWVTDPERSAKFYESVLGYKAHTVEEQGGDNYVVLVRNGRPEAGIVKLPWDDVKPNWLPYLRVADVVATIERIKTAGGALLVEPSNAYDEGRMAIVSDPTGGVFAIQARRSDR